MHVSSMFVNMHVFIYVICTRVCIHVCLPLDIGMCVRYLIYGQSPVNVQFGESNGLRSKN